jgi:hypothetical protein
MSLIRDIRIVPLEFSLPAGEGYGSSRGLTNRRGGGLVILETEDGVQGIGESWGPPAVSRAYLEMGSRSMSAAAYSRSAARHRPCWRGCITSARRTSSSR